MTQEAPAAPAAPAAAPANAAPEVPAGETATPEAPKPEKTFTQAELDDILEKRLSKERRKREEARRENEVLRKLALERSERREEPAKQHQSSAEAEPKREQFDTYEAFIEARAEWRADQKVEKRFAERDQQSQQEKAKAEAETNAKTFKERIKTLSKDIPNFDEVMAEATSDPEAPVSRLFAEPIQECENPAAVLHHLATNTEEAERIASLPGHKQAREIWALDARLKGDKPAAPKKPSAAPEPIAPVGGKATKGDDEPDPSNTKAWIAWRERQIQKKRTGT